MHGANNCWIDHRLILSRVNICLKPQPQLLQKNTPWKSFNMDNLEDPAHLQDFVAALGKELSSTPVPPATTTTEELWQSFKYQVVKITMEVLGFTLRKDQDQFDDNDPKISRLIDENQ